MSGQASRADSANKASSQKSAAAEASNRAKPTPGGPGGARKKNAGGRGTPHHITPEEALENTRSLLEAKKARDRQPQPWQEQGGAHPNEAKGGYESDSARDKALELHRGEAGLNAIEGGISDRDHRRQGKRDSR